MRIHVGPYESHSAAVLPIEHSQETLEEHLTQGPPAVLGVWGQSKHTVSYPVHVEFEHLVIRSQN